MPPSLTEDNKGDRHLADTDRECNMFLPLSGAKSRLDFSYLVLGKLCVSVFRPNIIRLRSSRIIRMVMSSINHVLDVLFLRSLAKMARVETFRIVAGMKHEESAEYASVVKFERKAWDSPILAFKSDYPIAITAFLEWPKQASFRAVVLGGSQEKLPLLFNNSAFIHSTNLA